VDPHSLEAKYIYVDLQKDLDYKRSTFGEALCVAVWKAANLSMQDFPNDITPKNIFDMLKEKCGKSSIFLIIDEVGEVNDLAKIYKDLEPELTENRVLNLTKPYYVFFKYLSAIAELQGIFLYVCGKSTELTSFSESAVTQSPVVLKKIHLPTLNEEYINQILMETIRDGVTLENKINLSSKLKSTFLKLMYEYTRGVPRLLRRCFEYLNACPLTSNCTVEELTDVFEISLYNHVQRSFGSFLVPRGALLSVKMMNCYRLCIYLNLMGFCFGEAQIIETTPGNMISMMNAMSDLCIYYEKVNTKIQPENIYAYLKGGCLQSCVSKVFPEIFARKQATPIGVLFRIAGSVFCCDGSREKY
jgi:hypothetical protein